MDWIQTHILTLVIFFPLVVAGIAIFLPEDGKKAFFWLAAIGATIEFLLSLHLYFYFKNTGSMEFIELAEWIPQWKAQYFIGIDGVSLLLILLTTFLTPIIVLGSWNSIETRFKQFVISLLVLETGMIGVFAALDLFLFYIFWEAMLIPMYFLIGIWGGKRRIYAAIKFFIYTMFGSVLMLAGILYLYFDAGQSFNLLELYNHKLAFTPQLYVFLGFALAFAIKVPLFPLHTWLPDAHVEAPTAGSVILAGVLLKMGTYGFFRFAMPLFPDALIVAQPYLIILAVIGIIYGALVALVQTDIKKLVAYSSVSHLGVVMLGLFALNETAITGGLYQSLNHGLSTGGLFLLVGMLYERTHSREIKLHSGIAKQMPLYAVAFLLVSFSSIGVPLTNGFIGEFLTLIGTFQTHRVAAIWGTTGVILSAFYMLWLVERVCFGSLKTPDNISVKDLSPRELVVLIPLLIFIMWMGIQPSPFLDKLKRPAETLLLQMSQQPESAQLDRNEKSPHGR